MKIILKMWDKNGKMAGRYFSDKTRRFTSNSVPASFLKAKVLVLYGKRLCNFGCLCEFTNSGTYYNKPDLMQAIRSFIEK